MKTIAVIPARMGSSRFPGKPLADILGLPMIGHVYQRTRLCPGLDAVYVATCDREIFDYVTSIGGRAVMTGSHHERCTTRTAECMEKVEAETGERVQTVVMVQGDEPMVTPGMIELALRPMADPAVRVVNLMARLETAAEFEDPNEVKVVVDQNGDALYFSREPIPSLKKGAQSVDMFKQVCIIPFRRDFLPAFNAMAETPLERAESVDMLRILEHGGKVRMVECAERTLAVDTPGDLARVVEMMREDPLRTKYS
jgi:3-deoxy-manno-octulosonate cytidylyltransferase (CMP-KDO synthetase)